MGDVPETPGSHATPARRTSYFRRKWRRAAGLGEKAGKEHGRDQLSRWDSVRKSELKDYNTSFPMVNSLKSGDPVAVVLFALILYIVTSRSAEYLPTLAAVFFTFYGSRVYYKLRLLRATSRLKAVHDSALQWTPISPTETAIYVNWTVASLWEETIAPKITNKIRSLITNKIHGVKLPWFIASAAVKEVDLGANAPKVGNFQVMQNKFGRQVCEADIAFDGDTQKITLRLVLKKLTKLPSFLGGANLQGGVDITAHSLLIEGRIRYVPLVNHPLSIIQFAEMPKVRFDLAVSGVPMTAIPALKRFVGDIISEALGRKLMFPGGIPVELGRRDKIVKPQRGTLEIKFNWADLWNGWKAEKDKNLKKTEKKSGLIHKLMRKRQYEEDVSRGDGDGGDSSDASSDEGDVTDVEEEPSGEDTLKVMKGTLVELVVDKERPPGVPVRDGLVGASSSRKGLIKDVVVVDSIEAFDEKFTLSFPLTDKSDKVSILVHHGGYLAHGVIGFKWCSRTMHTHCWIHAPVKDMKIDTMTLSSSESANVILGLHTQSGPKHPTVGCCSLDVKFKWDRHTTVQRASVAGVADAASSAGASHSDGKTPGAAAKESSRGRSIAERIRKSTIGAMKKERVGSTCGILQVDVVRARNLPVRDAATGTSDPYAKLKMNGRVGTTAVRAGTLTPVWEHRMFFPAFPPGLNDRMVLRVFDRDVQWFSKDDFMGRADIEPDEFLDGELHSKWVKLAASESGEVHLRFKFARGAVDAPPGGWDVEEHITEAQALQMERASWGEGRTKKVSQLMLESKVAARDGVIYVKCVGAADLQVADVLTGSSDPYLVVRCGSAQHKTKVKSSTLSPRWGETFEIPVSPLQRLSGRVLFECRDRDAIGSDDFLGNATLEISDVPEDGATQEYALSLEGVDRGMIQCEAWFKPLGPPLDLGELAKSTPMKLGRLESGKAGRSLIKGRQRKTRQTGRAGCCGARRRHVDASWGDDDGEHKNPGFYDNS
jgi:hypothetical protein